MSICGVSADGRYLFWMLIDGRQPGFSEGANSVEAADLIKSLGASDALRMDGGSVCTLVKAGRWFPTVVNRPSHPVFRGIERPIGGLFGIRVN